MEAENKPQEPRRRDKRKTFLWIAGIFLALVIIGAIAGGGRSDRSSENKSATDASGTSDDSRDVARLDTAATVADTGTTAATSTETAMPTIPGLVAVDVYGNFKERDFNCETISTSDGTSWICKDEKPDRHYSVDVYGSGPMAIASVRYTSLAFGGSADDVARDFLGYGASLTYDGAEPARAQSWVRENVGKDAETTIGGMTYTLTASGSARILRIAP